MIIVTFNKCGSAIVMHYVVVHLLQSFHKASCSSAGGRTCFFCSYSPVQVPRGVGPIV